MPPLPRRALAATLALTPALLFGGPLLDRVRERQDTQRNATEPAPGAGARAGLRGEVPLPAGARLLRDLPFGPDPQQKLDVYVPAGAQRAPIVFMVHGGAWMLGDKATLPVVEAKVARWLPKGYLLVSTNYRLSAQPRVLDQLDDVARALAYTQSRAADWGADASRVLVIGHSAGAHLVTLLAGASDVASRHGVRPWLGTISLDSAALDLVDLMERPHAGFYDRVFGNDRALWTAASPWHRLQTAAAPMLLVCASGRADACRQAGAFARKQQSLGGTATVLPVDMSHGDTNTLLGVASPYTLRVESFMNGLGLP